MIHESTQGGRYYEFKMRNMWYAAQGREEAQGVVVADLALAHRLVSGVEGLPGATGREGEVEYVRLRLVGPPHWAFRRLLLQLLPEPCVSASLRYLGSARL